MAFTARTGRCYGAGTSPPHLAGREVTLLTYDTGPSTRARSAGPRVLKLTARERKSGHTGLPVGCAAAARAFSRLC
jgi:hypothetical protein